MMSPCSAASKHNRAPQAAGRSSAWSSYELVEEITSSTHKQNSPSEQNLQSKTRLRPHRFHEARQLQPQVKDVGGNAFDPAIWR